MTEKNTISDYITFPTTFENYKWYKPILVFIVGLVMFAILSALLIAVFWVAFGSNFVMSIVTGGYEVMNTVWGQIFTDLGVIIMLPSLYLASKIVKDRPFSSYASSRGGFNFKLYLKAFAIPFALIIQFNILSEVDNYEIIPFNSFSFPLEQTMTLHYFFTYVFVY